MEIAMETHQENKNRTIEYDPDITLRDMLKRVKVSVQ